MVWEYCVLVWVDKSVKITYLQRDGAPLLEVRDKGLDPSHRFISTIGRLGTAGWEMSGAQAMDYHGGSVKVGWSQRSVGHHLERWLYFKRRLG